MAKREQRRANTNNALSSSSGKNADIEMKNLGDGGSGRRQGATSAAVSSSGNGGGASSSQKSENNLAFVLIGIVIMHIACHMLRVFLAVMAVKLIDDTVYCMQNHNGFVPPLWSMCAESVSSLLIMINFSGNFLIYCSVLKPFKEFFARKCLARAGSSDGGGNNPTQVSPLGRSAVRGCVVATREENGVAAEPGKKTTLFVTEEASPLVKV